MTQDHGPAEIVLPLPQGIGDGERQSLRDQAGYLAPGITAVEASEDSLRLHLSAAPDAGARARLEADFAELLARTRRSFRKVGTKTVDRSDGAPAWDQDPMPALRETRQAIEAAHGTFTIRGDLLRVFQGLDAHFRALALSLGAEEQAYPTTVPVASLNASGYIGNFPHHALLVARVHADLGTLADTAAASEAAVPTDRLAPAEQMLAPTVCYHCFEALRGQDVAQTGRLFTATAHCHRHEGAATTGLSRLQTFTMREIVFFGTPDAVTARKQALMDAACETFERWQLGFELATATDPFFAVNSESKRAFQSLRALKHEMRLRLPFDGSTIASASFNNHQDTLVRPYAITGSGADEDGGLHSGCVGYGFERLALGLFAHFGMDPARWPDPVRQDLTL